MRGIFEMAYCSDKVRIGLGIDKELYDELIERSRSSNLSYARIVEEAIYSYLHQSDVNKFVLLQDLKDIKKLLSQVQIYIKRG